MSPNNIRSIEGNIAIGLPMVEENQEKESREPIAYLGFEWEPACLAFHKTQRAVKTTSLGQVRKKMYQGSSQAWRNYEPFLDDMIKVLDGL